MKIPKNIIFPLSFLKILCIIDVAWGGENLLEIIWSFRVFSSNMPIDPHEMGSCCKIHCPSIRLTAYILYVSGFTFQNVSSHLFRISCLYKYLFQFLQILKIIFADTITDMQKVKKFPLAEFWGGQIFCCDS